MKLYLLGVFAFVLFFAGEPTADQMAAAKSYVQGRWEIGGHPSLHAVVFHKGNLVTLHTKSDSGGLTDSYQFCYRINSLSAKDKVIAFEFYMMNGFEELDEPRRTVTLKIADRDHAVLSTDKGIADFPITRSLDYMIPK